MKIKILLFGEKESCVQVQRLLMQDEDFSIVGMIHDDRKILDAIDNFRAEIVLITEVSAMTLRVCQQVYLLRPRAIPVILNESLESSDVGRIMQTGVHYILTYDMDALTFSSEIKSIYHNESNRFLAMENTNATSSKARVITVFGAKDGLGKTTLAVNLAVALAKKKNKVVLLDYDFQFGDLTSYLGQYPKNSILELVQEQGNPNADLIRQFLTLHESGVSFLPAPHSPEYAGSVTVEQAERIISSLRVYYDYVIIDCPSGFDNLSTTCLDCASMILFLSARDIPGLRDAKKSLAVLLALVQEEKVKLLMGKSSDSSAKSIRDTDIFRVLGQPVWKTIPYDEKSALLAANQGKPAVLNDRHTKLCRAIISVANEIDGTSSPELEEAPKSRLRLLLSGKKG